MTRRVRCFRDALLVTLLLVSLAVGAAADDWPNWRGPTHDGISLEKDWKPQALSDAKVLWRANVGVGHSSFAVADGKVYTMGNARNRDQVFCFDAATGKEVWKKSYPCGAGNYAGPRATPTVDGKYVYTFSREGHLCCFDAASGRSKWDRKLNVGMPSWGLASSPLINGSRVIVNAGAAGMAFSKRNGRPSWGRGGTGGYASVVPMKRGSRTTLLVFGERELIGVSTGGRRSFSYPWQTSHNVNAADPVVAGNRVFITSGYGKGCAMLSSSGRRVWQNTHMRAHFNSPVHYKNYLYGFDDASLVCLDAKDGGRKWTERAPRKGGLMLADDKLIIQGESGEVMIAEASPDRYKQIARARVGLGHSWTAPVLANGRLYCRDDRGNVVCIDVSGK